jgi:hypothetical protein
MFLTSNDENKLFFVLFIYNSFFYINKISNLFIKKKYFIQIHQHYKQIHQGMGEIHKHIRKNHPRL